MEGGGRMMDSLSAEMVQCKKDGFGCRYGQWKALQEHKPIKPRQEEKYDAEHKKTCEWCGAEFMFSRKTQRFCSMRCYHKAWYQRRRKQT